jgi:DNA-binding LacI/PurR family transcriptional regulator
MTAPGAGGERASKDGGERLRAFVDIAASVGIRFPDELVAFGAHTDRGGAVAMEQLLERDLGLTAIVASNDASATGAHAVLRRRGLGVPSEVSLVGMDDRAGCVEHGLSLTTVRFPLEELGRRAGLALQSRLRGLGNHKRGQNRVASAASLDAAALNLKRQSADPPTLAGVSKSSRRGDDRGMSIPRQGRGTRCREEFTELREPSTPH